VMGGRCDTVACRPYCLWFVKSIRTTATIERVSYLAAGEGVTMTSLAADVPRYILFSPKLRRRSYLIYITTSECNGTSHIFWCNAVPIAAFFRLLASFHSWVAAAVDLLLRRQMMPLTLNVDRAGTVTFVFNIDEILNVAKMT